MWWGGIVMNDDDASGPEYSIVDAETNKPLSDRYFYNPDELEDYIAAHYPGCERWVPPSPPPEEVETVGRLLEKYARGELDNDHIRHTVRGYLINHLYQSGYSPDITARIRAVIEALK
jgi:hypothetical protein